MINWKKCGKVAIAMIPFAAAVVVVATSNPTVIRIQGPCDPATFAPPNVPPGTCVGNGTITFDHFIKELAATQKVGSWHFDPSAGTLAAGTALSLENRAGETHTFTKVKEFGGGFVPELNVLSGNPVPAPECFASPSPSNIFLEAGETEAGPTTGSSIMPSGTTTKFQCCIHPWMRTELTTK